MSLSYQGLFCSGREAGGAGGAGGPADPRRPKCAGIIFAAIRLTFRDARSAGRLASLARPPRVAPLANATGPLLPATAASALGPAAKEGARLPAAGDAEDDAADNSGLH